MDPNECLRLMLAATTAGEASEHGDNLRSWLRNGGFAPEAPSRYWPGTGTPFAVLSPGPDNGHKWQFVVYAPNGKCIERWTLPPRA